MTTEVDVNSQGGAAGPVNTVLRILAAVEKTSEKGAATILFIVGISLFVFVYAIKFVELPLSKEMTSGEFMFSVATAVLLILFGAATRIFLYYLNLSESKEVSREIIEAENRVIERRGQSLDDSKNHQSKAYSGVA